MTTSPAGNEDDDYSHTADQQSSKSQNNWVHFCSWKKRNVYYTQTNVIFWQNIFLEVISQINGSGRWWCNDVGKTCYLNISTTVTNKQ